MPKQLLVFTFVFILLAGSLVAQTALKGTAKVSGTAKLGQATPTPTPPSGARGVTLNGTTQDFRVTLPNSTPFISMGAFSMEFRLRNPANVAGLVFQVRGSDVTPLFDLSFNGSLWVFLDWRDGVQMFLTPATLADSKYRLQYDPANVRWTFESWNADGTGHVQSTLAIATATDWALGNGTLIIGAGYYDNFLLAGSVDWFRWHDTVVVLNSSAPPETAASGPTYRARWEFEDSLIDSAAVAGTLTPLVTPVYEDTP